MTKEDIARMARESGGLPDPMVFVAAYERFANLVAAAKWERTSASFDEWWGGDYDDSANPYHTGTPAYWAWAGWQAAQRKWVGLTDEDWRDVANETDRIIWPEVRKAIEAKLKERNND